MTDRGELLELLYEAGGRIPTLRGRVRTWLHVERQRVAMDKEHNPGLGTSVAYLSRRGGQGSEPTGESELSSRLLVADGGRRWRLERLDGRAPNRALSFTNGTTAWHQVGDGEVVAHHHAIPLTEAAELLDPTWLVGYDWSAIRTETHLDRDVIIVDIRRRPGPMARRFHAGPMPVEAEVSVDASLGFLHRLVALDDGQPYRIVEFIEIDLDPVVGEADFTPDGLGLKVIEESEWARRMRPPLPKRLWRAVRHRRMRRRMRSLHRR